MMGGRGGDGLQDLAQAGWGIFITAFRRGGTAVGATRNNNPSQLGAGAEFRRGSREVVELDPSNLELSGAER
jgi:hypothetical protein